MTTPPSIQITAPGDLVAVVPCVLKFHPSQSLVLVSFAAHSSRIGPVLRADLPAVGDVEAGAAQMLDMLPAQYRDHAVLLAISTESREDACRDASLVLTAAGVRVTGAIYATGTRPGDQWRCLEPGCSDAGTVPQPHTEIAAHLAWTGQVTLPNREAIEQTLTPLDDAATLARRSRLLTEAATASAEPRPSLAAAVDDYLTRHQLDDDLVVALVAALGQQRAVLKHLREHTSTMRVVLEALVRETPAPWSAAPAAYLALAALLHGDGAHAAAAAERATIADPVARLPQLIAEVVASTPSPDTVRGLLSEF
ncbi:DUF4192 domain-containing protein [Pseudonocardia parietis]|uniref:DUF4192 domain-containing protein n=1 Tax=Pseudonocardia parietis TaxID=570936 RepID=A0ABS4W628_9PSEU|nr:DUF4192 domain-containing protein [Pseudonocardia parietis]MBP2371667.1 hypothetical protein [Pseudonocardia parietis]